MIAHVFLIVVALYCAIGALVAVLILGRGLGRLDPEAADMSGPTRVLLFPGMLLLWPLMLILFAGVRGEAETEARMEDLERQVAELRAETAKARKAMEALSAILGRRQSGGAP